MADNPWGYYSYIPDDDYDHFEKSEFGGKLMSTELQVITEGEDSLQAVIAKRDLIQQLLKKVLIQGEDYGVIPGTKKKSLLKSGAEKLCTLFHLAPSYHKLRFDLPGSHREYEITTTMTHIPSGNVVGAGEGSCSTMESKYRWRNAKHVCPACKQEAVIKGKKEYGGGWSCWKKEGVSDGCGAKYEDGDPSIEGQVVGKIENPDVPDQWNTVLKMAKKRSLNDAVLTCTSASDIFTQDVDETPPPETKPAVKQEPKPDTPKTNGNGDANAFWGIINKRIPEIMNLDNKQIRRVCIAISELASECNEAVGTYVNRVTVDKAIENALERLELIKKEN